MYGAISNQGRVKVDGQWHDVHDPSPNGALAYVIASHANGHDVIAKCQNARKSCGFSPWEPAEVLGHGGMGGSYAMCNTRKGYSVAVLKSAYSSQILRKEKHCHLVASVLSAAESVFS